MSFYHRHINPDAIPSHSHGIIDVMPQDYEAEIERAADGGIVVHWIEPIFHESIEDDIHDKAHDIFMTCPEQPGRYMAEAFRYNGNNTADPASRFLELGAFL